MSALGLYTEGKLSAAVEDAAAAVRRRPRDLDARLLFGELTAIAGDLRRAESHFTAIIDLAASGGHERSECEADVPATARAWCGLLAAARAREEFFAGYRLPSFIDEAFTEASKLLLEASVEMRAGADGRAGELVEEARQRGGAVAGEADGVGFEAFRDLDDLCAEVLELLSVEGDYLWVPIERVTRLEFLPPVSPLSRHWRPVRLTLKAGDSRLLAMPSTYGLLDGADEAELVGLRTRWVGSSPAPIRGVGQRMFLVDGSRELDLMDLSTVVFHG